MKSQQHYAEQLARQAHAFQKYGNKSYADGHLMLVARLLYDAGFSDDIVCAGWLHDIIEDTDITYEEINEGFGAGVADIVSAVTSDSSLSRKERMSISYKHILECGSDAISVKLADRICNVKSCWKNEDSRLYMYHKEYRAFRGALRSDTDNQKNLSMWNELDALMGWNNY